MGIIKCYKFFGINRDFNEMLEVEIPENGFNLLLKVIEILGYDENMFRIINKNLPKKLEDSDLIKSIIKKINISDELSSGGNGKGINIYNTKSGKLEENRFFELKIGYITTICYSPNGLQILTGEDNNCNNIKIWNSNTGKLIRGLKGHKIGVGSICYSSNGLMLASAGGDGYVKLWNPNNGKLIYKLIKHEGPVLSICFSSDCHKLYSGGLDSKINIWDTKNGKLIKSLNEHIDGISGLCYSNNQNQLASSSYDGTIKIWDSNKDNLLYTLESHTKEIFCISYSPIDPYLASGSDNIIKIWNTSNAKLMNTINWYGDITFRKNYEKKSCLFDVINVCYSPDGSKLASSSNESIIKMWNSKTGNLISEIYDNAGAWSLCFVPCLYNKLLKLRDKL